jgi:aryl-alcohol dehydrogenase-like predicted oxidoreductase
VNAIPTAPFGRTGHNSTRVIFGAAALAQASENEAAETLELVFERGINHIDVAASYGDAEVRLQPWLRDHRAEVFLATKTGDRTSAAARESLLQSLDRMGIDQIDLIQLHNLVHPGEWETALGADGALEALVEARAEGLVRFIGVTGHGLTAPWMHARALERFPFDSVLAPYNAVAMQSPQYGADFEALAALCAERTVALQTIKAITAGPWGIGPGPRPAGTWYEPLTDPEDIEIATHWVLGRDGVFLNSVGDLALLPLLLDAAARFDGRPDDATMAELIERRQMTPLFVS